MAEETIFIEVPCELGSLQTTGSMFIQIIVPGHGVAAWVSPNDLTILKQPITDERLRGSVRARLIREEEDGVTVALCERGLDRRLFIPDTYFDDYVTRWDIPLAELSPVLVSRLGKNTQ